MYSQCPDCLTRFRVTADALRLAHGTVRCGRCGSAFDALARLSDSIPPPGRHEPAAPLAAVVPMDPLAAEGKVPPSEYHFSADDLEKVFIDLRDWEGQFGPATAGAAEITGQDAEPPVLVVDESGRHEDITLEGERIHIEHLAGLGSVYEETVAAQAAAGKHDLDSTDRFEALTRVPEATAFDEKPWARAAEVEAQAAASPPPAATAVETAHVAPAAVAALAAERPGASGAEILEPEGAAAEPDMGAVLLEELAPSPRRTLAWTLGSLVLALALVVQLTHHYRQELVRHPQLGPPLATLYERLGLPLAPNWDPRGYALRQWGGSDTNATPGELTLRASITNRADFAQPLPLLRLEIEDRFGAAVAIRDFEPREYLKDPAMASRLLPSGASAEGSLEIADPGVDGVGYRIDVCLRESPKLLRCAQGPG